MSAHIGHGTLIFVEGIAAGAILTMICAAMLPEAAHLAYLNLVGLSTLTGFLSMTPIWFISASVFAADGVPERLMSYVMFDVATEKDAVSPIKNEYFNKHITVGVKTPKKWEYSLKLGTSDKDAQTYELMNNVLEGKIKKSFELKKEIYPYFAARFGEKTFSAKAQPYTSSFMYYSLDVGTKLSLSSAWGLDIGARWRDSDKYEYKSKRCHAILLRATAKVGQRAREA